MSKAKSGDMVTVHYTGKFADGTAFDSSLERDEPMKFKLGEGKLIPGFEGAVDGMSIGEKTTVDIPAAEAYGETRPELVIKLPRDKFPEPIDPAIGQSLQLRQPDGGMFEVVVTEIAEDSVTLDANHPLAGHDLTFDIELTGINE